MSRFPPLHRVARSALLAGQAAPSAWPPPVLWVVPGGMTERMTGALPSTGRHQGVPCLTTPIDYGWVVRGSPQSRRPPAGDQPGADGRVTVLQPTSAAICRGPFVPGLLLHGAFPG